MILWYFFSASRCTKYDPGVYLEGSIDRDRSKDFESSFGYIYRVLNPFKMVSIDQGLYREIKMVVYRKNMPKE